MKPQGRGQSSFSGEQWRGMSLELFNILCIGGLGEGTYNTLNWRHKERLVPQRRPGSEVKGCGRERHGWYKLHGLECSISCIVTGMLEPMRFT